MTLEQEITDRRELIRLRLAGGSIEILSAGTDQLRALAFDVMAVSRLIDNLADVAGQVAEIVDPEE